MTNNDKDVIGSLFEDESDIRESPVIEISDDSMEAFIVMPEKPLQVDIRELLDELGVEFGIDEELVDDINRKLFDKMKMEKRYLIAKGKQAVHGHPAELILRTKKPEDVILSSEDLTRVDYKVYKRKLLALGEKDKPVAMIIDPTEGHDGMDIFGNVIEGVDGEDVKLVLGANVERSGKKLISHIDGLVEYKKAQDDTIYFDISEIYYVQGDVDYTTGNIDFPGSVIVKGIIKAGFEVLAKNEVVAETIRGSVITGGSVIAKQGIIGGTQKAYIEAGGTVTAKFTQYARILAGGEVNIKRSIITSEIFSDESVVVEGNPGSIIGGKVTASSGIHAKVLGSESYAKTEVALFKSAKSVILLKNIVSKRFEVNKNLLRIDTYLGENRDVLFKGFKGDKQELIGKLIKKRDQLRQELLDLNSQLRKIQEVLVSPVEGKIQVDKVAWPEVRISISGKFILLKKERGKGAYYYNKAEDSLEFK